MTVTINIAAGQKIERVPAVVTNYRRYLKARPEAVPRTLDNAGNDDLMPLIKVRKRAFGGQISLIVRRKVAVEIGGIVDRFAVGVATTLLMNRRCSAGSGDWQSN